MLKQINYLKAKEKLINKGVFAINTWQKITLIYKAFWGASKKCKELYTCITLPIRIIFLSVFMIKL